MSDTHQLHDFPVPKGDVLIHAGDFTNTGAMWEVEKFAAWFRAFPHPIKLVVPGNHEYILDEKFSAIEPRVMAKIAICGMPWDRAGVEYLQDRYVEAGGLKVYGSPWTPKFNDWAFMMPPERLHEKFDAIPSGLDILVTHGPAYNILDHSKHLASPAGSTALHEAIESARPRLHVCGHIHEGYGIKEVNGIIRVNAAIRAYEAKYNPPIVVEL